VTAPPDLKQRRDFAKANATKQMGSYTVLAAPAEQVTIPDFRTVGNRPARARATTYGYRFLTADAAPKSAYRD